MSFYVKHIMGFYQLPFGVLQINKLHLRFIENFCKFSMHLTKKTLKFNT
jgi:hypothetical protein